MTQALLNLFWKLPLACGIFSALIVSGARADSPATAETTTASETSSPLEISPSVRVQVYENVPDRSWEFELQAAEEEFIQPTFAFISIPHKYNDRGVIADRSAVFLVRASATVQLQPGSYRLLLRSLGGARVKLDDEVVATTPFLAPGGGGHESVPPLPKDIAPGLRQLAPSHHEKLTTFTSDGNPKRVLLEAFVGGKSFRQELGELIVAIEAESEPGIFRVLAPRSEEAFPLTDDAWDQFAQRERVRLLEAGKTIRSQRSARETEYWTARHMLAQAVAEQWRISPPSDKQDNLSVDAFIDAKLTSAKVAAAPEINDLAYLRRVTLDLAGVIPTTAEIDAYLQDSAESRRQHAVGRLLEDNRWADQWMGYWQDMLAENPGILKPMLNNTGPFRWWLYESLLDNKPIDRMVTELVMMEGSTYYGGPAGFAMATQNDVPMAEKAHVLGQAFLGVQMKCARCHDAPHHDVRQQDLFSIAAMLSRHAEKVPKSSSIPLSKDAIEGLLVKVTLQPGSSVEPDWPFSKLISSEAPTIPKSMIRSAEDSREQLALRITWPENRRFAQVMVNRLWQHYMGAGLVEPVDDWQDYEASHPELLDFLARELILHDYDLKHVARLIVSSHAYARQVTPEGAKTATAINPKHRLFASPARRRMAAEQVVDSLLVAAGKEMNCETLTMDRPGRRSASTFLNLGTPRRAWELTSLSNERDRPSLAFPHTQGVIDTLTAFGWRESRQDPISVRDDAPMIQQPAILANGMVAGRSARLSDDGSLTELAVRAESADRLVEGLFLQILTRQPTDAERRWFVELLEPGFSDRVNQGVPPAAKVRLPRYDLSWANHLSPEANVLKQELEQAARAGDPPSPRLKTEWRERAESAVWVLLNSPEFVFLP